MAAAAVTSNHHTPSDTASEKQNQVLVNGASPAEATANSLDNLDNPRFKELQRYECGAEVYYGCSQSWRHIESWM